MVSDTLRIYDVPPECLVLEITESLSMTSDESVVETFSKLKEIGVKIAIDDFGTGQSSLRYLSTLPLDILKIDYSFISRICDNKFDKGVVSTILTLAGHLDLEVVGEGIEREEQLSLLISLGLKTAQGYYFSEPLPFQKFNALLTDSITDKETAV